MVHLEEIRENSNCSETNQNVKTNKHGNRWGAMAEFVAISAKNVAFSSLAARYIVPVMAWKTAFIFTLPEAICCSLVDISADKRDRNSLKYMIAFANTIAWYFLSNPILGIQLTLWTFIKIELLSAIAASAVPLALLAVVAILGLFFAPLVNLFSS